MPFFERQKREREEREARGERAPARKIPMVKMWDPEKRAVVSVAQRFVGEEEARGLTRQLPGQEQRRQLEEASRTGVQATFRPNTGVTTVEGERLEAPPVTEQVTPPVEEVAPPVVSRADELAALQEQEKIAGLERVRAEALGALGAEEEAIAPAFAEQRAAQRAASRLGAQQFAEFMAQRGLTRAGGAALGETQRLGALQAGLGALGRQEVQRLADIERRRTGIETGFAQDVEAAKAGIQAEALQRQIEEGRRAETQARQDYLATIGRFAQDYMAEIERVRDDGDPTNDWQIPYLEAARQHKVATEGRDPVTGELLPFEPEVTPMTRNEAMKLWSIVGAATPEIAKTLDVEEKMQYSTYAGRRTTKAPKTADVTASQYSAYSGAIDRLEDKITFKTKQDQFDWIARNEDRLRADMGDKMYNQLLKDIQKAEIAEPEVEEVQNVTSIKADIKRDFITPGRWDEEGKYIKPITDKEGIEAHIVRLHKAGQINRATAARLLSDYGIAFEE